MLIKYNRATDADAADGPEEAADAADYAAVRNSAFLASPARAGGGANEWCVLCGGANRRYTTGSFSHTLWGSDWRVTYRCDLNTFGQFW